MRKLILLSCIIPLLIGCNKDTTSTQTNTNLSSIKNALKLSSAVNADLEIENYSYLSSFSNAKDFGHFGIYSNGNTDGSIKYSNIELGKIDNMFANSNILNKDHSTPNYQQVSESTQGSNVEMNISGNSLLGSATIGCTIPKIINLTASNANGNINLTWNPENVENDIIAIFVYYSTSTDRTDETIKTFTFANSSGNAAINVSSLTGIDFNQRVKIVAARGNINSANVNGKTINAISYTYTDVTLKN